MSVPASAAQPVASAANSDTELASPAAPGTLFYCLSSDQFSFRLPDMVR